jgi:hypothetical protein
MQKMKATTPKKITVPPHENVVFNDPRDNEITLVFRSADDGTIRVYRGLRAGHKIAIANWEVTAGLRWRKKEEALSFLKTQGYTPLREIKARIIRLTFEGSKEDAFFSDENWSYKFDDTPPVVLQYEGRTLLLRGFGTCRNGPCLHYVETFIKVRPDRFSINEEPPVHLNPIFDDEDDDEPKSRPAAVLARSKPGSLRSIFKHDEDDEEEDDF